MGNTWGRNGGQTGTNRERIGNTWGTNGEQMGLITLRAGDGAVHDEHHMPFGVARRLHHLNKQNK